MALIYLKFVFGLKWNTNGGGGIAAHGEAEPSFKFSLQKVDNVI